MVKYLKLDVQQKAIFVQEEKFKGRILTLKKQLEVAERKVMNAKYLSESHETLSAESQMYFLHSENQKCEVDYVGRGTQRPTLSH